MPEKLHHEGRMAGWTIRATSAPSPAQDGKFVVRVEATKQGEDRPSIGSTEPLVAPENVEQRARQRYNEMIEHLRGL